MRSSGVTSGSFKVASCDALNTLKPSFFRSKEPGQKTNKQTDEDFLNSGGGEHRCEQSQAGLETAEIKVSTKEPKLKVSANKTDFKMKQETVRK